MSDIDFKKQFNELYSARQNKVQIVQVPALNYLAIDGQGDPQSGDSFQASMEALYGVAYAVRSNLKKAPDPVEYIVPPLEGLWWMTDGSRFSVEDRDTWSWTLMIPQPDMVTSDMFEEARVQVQKKKKKLTTVQEIRFDLHEEGLSAQILHAGPYDQEGPTLSALHRYIALNGYHPDGKHHEVYLNDPRRSAPDKLRTILRQPVKKV
jgi:hypothetical protein